MTHLVPRETNDSYHFEGYLSALERALRRGEYDVTLTAQVYDLPETDVDPMAVLTAAFPGGHNAIGRIETTTLDAMVDDVHATLRVCVEGRDERDREELRGIEQGLREGYWAGLRALVSLDDTTIVSCGPDVPYVNVADGFCYILTNRSERRAVIVTGTVCD